MAAAWSNGRFAASNKSAYAALRRRQQGKDSGPPLLLTTINTNGMTVPERLRSASAIQIADDSQRRFMLARCTPAAVKGVVNAARPAIAAYRIAGPAAATTARRSDAPPASLPTNNCPAPADKSRIRCASRASPVAARCATTRCHASSARRDLLHHGLRFSAGCISSQPATFATSLRPRWCRPDDLQYCQMITQALFPARRPLRHCSKRFPVALPPHDNLRLLQFGHRLALPVSQVGAHGSGSPGLVTIRRQLMATRVCAHCANFAFFRAHTPGAYQRRRVFVARRTSRAVCRFQPTRFAQPGFSSCHQSPRRCRQTRPVSFISPYSGSAKDS